MVENKIFGKDGEDKIEVRNLLSSKAHASYLRLQIKALKLDKEDIPSLLELGQEQENFLLTECGVSVVTVDGEKLKFDKTLLTTDAILERFYNEKARIEAVKWIIAENNLNLKSAKKPKEGNLQETATKS